jgi:aminoacylase
MMANEHCSHTATAITLPVSQYNVIPTEAFAGFDCRIPATTDLADFKAQLDEWCSEEGVSYELVGGTGDGGLQNPTTPPESEWFKRFSGACRAAGADLGEPSIFPAATDSRWLRLALGVPCIGFSPMRRTPVLLHDHDEFIGVDTFLEGIRIYAAVLPKLADA